MFTLNEFIIATRNTTLKVNWWIYRSTQWFRASATIVVTMVVKLRVELRWAKENVTTIAKTNGGGDSKGGYPDVQQPEEAYLQFNAAGGTKGVLEAPGAFHECSSGKP